MVQVMFFLRFRTQLRRIQPEMITSLEKSIVTALESAGGRLEPERRFFVASFDEKTLGLWLDILFVIKLILETLERVSSEIYGYACVIGRDVPHEGRERLCRGLSFLSEQTGIWCAPGLQKFLDAYMNFAHPLSVEKNARIAANSLMAGYAQMEKIKPLMERNSSRGFLFRTKIARAIRHGPRRNAVLLGPDYLGKRDGLYHYCAGIQSGIPPLVIHFSAERMTLSCCCDLLTPQIRSFISEYAQPEVLKELEALYSFLFRERLQNKISPYVIQRSRFFFQSAVKNYTAAAESREGLPVLILENIHLADDTAVRLLIDSYAALPEMKSFLIYGTCSDEEKLKPWEGIFPRIIKFSSGDFSLPSPPEMPRDLWEIAYAVYLLGLFFPSYLMPRLLEEGGKNPAMISLAFDMLSYLGVIDRIEDPHPRLKDFKTRAEAILGPEKDKVRILVRRRLLAWVHAGEFRPCFNLLRILINLGEKGEDELVLKAIREDILNGTYEDIEKAVAEGSFKQIVGFRHSSALLYIFKTLKALHYGNDAEIRTVFQEPVPGERSFLQAMIQILLNLTGYYLGISDVKRALETVKDAMLLSQEMDKNSSQAYRLFSLANLAKGQVGETMEYISFAIETAEKEEQFNESAIAAYYAAGIHFLFGNVSKALRLARQAEEAAACCGQGGWVDRALFLRGKLYFEIGRYQDALDVFRFLERYPSGNSSRAKESTLSAWIYRTTVYLGHPKAEKPGAAEGDISLFELEAAYFSGDYEHIAALIDTFPPVLPGMDFLYIEQPDWRSGFAQCESLVVPLGQLQSRLLTTFHSLALGQMGAASPDKGQTAIYNMQRLTLNELLPEMDSFDAFYYYALYRVLQDAGAEQVDMNTAVSMAFKRLQRRASRIDEPETRRDFLNLNYWNRALSLVAKEYKLI
ncbi:MAG: hypothetical protein LBP42_01725 [Treponema sp.]|jgi:tetratricopeptide (TPR) repeat protein|nr:hypothetical protein [Treponema sp.]